MENLVGLKSLEITELEITGGELDDATSLIRLQVKGSIKPTQQLHLNVQGFVAAKCGFISPSSGFSAFVNVQGGKISFQASTVIDNSNGIVLKEATLKSIQADFDSIKLELSGLGVVFNPLVGFITEKIQQTLKDSIRSHVENSVKPQLQGLISSHLPFSVPLP